MTTICPTCGKREFHPEVHLYRRTLDGQRFTAELPSRRCGACGEELTSGAAGVKADEAITLALARGGVVGPEGFRWLRRSANLTGAELARLLCFPDLHMSVPASAGR